jgi:hypothetical protein
MIKVKWTKATRGIAYLSVLCILGGVFFLGYNHGTVDLESANTEMELAKKAHAKADSILDIHRVALVIMQAEMDSLVQQQAVSRDSTDQTIERVRNLTEVVVTPEVINEAITWIKEHQKDTVL